MIRRLSLLVGVLALTAVVSAGPAFATAKVDGGRWVLTGEDSVPLSYFQGLTHDKSSDFLFVGIFKGGYRTDGALKQLAGNDSLIPDAVEHGVGFNHIGDPTYDRAEGGRLLTPLECYDPSATTGDGNTCHMGGIGVVDPVTLAWRYWVRLDPADIPKAMWAEVSPDGRRLWTSSGPDLLAYSTADISQAHAAADAGATPIRPVARITNAVPPSGITGAAFSDGRLLLAGEADKTLQIWSVDLSYGTKNRLELKLPGVQAEPEGLDILDTLGGTLHFLLSPFGDNGAPTYGNGHSELLTFVPTAGATLRLKVSPARLRAGTSRKVTVTVRQVYGDGPHPVAGARVKVGTVKATSDARGRARLTVKARRRGTVKVRATKPGLRAGTAKITVTAGG